MLTFKIFYTDKVKDNKLRHLENIAHGHGRVGKAVHEERLEQSLRVVKRPASTSQSETLTSHMRHVFIEMHVSCVLLNGKVSGSSSSACAVNYRRARVEQQIYEQRSSVLGEENLE